MPQLFSGRRSEHGKECSRVGCIAESTDIKTMPATLRLLSTRQTTTPNLKHSWRKRRVRKKLGHNHWLTRYWRPVTGWQLNCLPDTGHQPPGYHLDTKTSPRTQHAWVQEDENPGHDDAPHLSPHYDTHYNVQLSTICEPYIVETVQFQNDKPPLKIPAGTSLGLLESSNLLNPWQDCVTYFWTISLSQRSLCKFFGHPVTQGKTSSHTRPGLFAARKTISNNCLLDVAGIRYTIKSIGVTLWKFNITMENHSIYWVNQPINGNCQ